jgi:hypothetical protein
VKNSIIQDLAVLLTDNVADVVVVVHGRGREDGGGADQEEVGRHNRSLGAQS